MCIEGGYKTQTVAQLANVLFAYDAGEVNLKAVRVYLAALVSVASREAAKRSRVRVKRRGDITPRFLIGELSRLSRLSESSVRKGLRALKKVGLLSFGESEILFETLPLEGSLELQSELSGGRPVLRPVPLPRTLLRFLAKCSKASTTKTALAYAVRGLTLSRKGEVTGKGSIKATTISRAMNISERSARSARAELLELGFITDDEGSLQRKLNRTGAYFTVNLSWREPRSLKGNTRGASVGAIKGPAAEGPPPLECNRAVYSSPVISANFAPPKVQNCSNFAPPYKDKKTPYGSKNQETQSSSLKTSGVCIANGGRGGGGLPAPNIRDVRGEDLKSFGRVEELYRQAVRVKLIEASEAGAINFISAAARAARVTGDAPRVFIGIVKRKLWNHITQADEDRALTALRKYRADNPQRFRVAA